MKAVGAPARMRAGRAFLARHGWADARATPLPQDASKRRYFRLRDGGRRAILMDAPPPETVDSFITVTRHLQHLGARVPAIAAADCARGFLLLEDLGEQTFARQLASGFDEAALYRLAVDALSAIRRHPRATAIDLPAYDSGRALAEANLLPDWYLPARLQRPVSAAARAEFAQIIEALLAGLPPLPPTLVLRDFHIDNLMLCAGACALLDYQDALIGSPAYDVASLLEDARRDLSPQLQRAMFDRYRAQNRELDADALRRHMTVWAAQRHCKVAGIFTRLWLRDGKDGYLRHLPRVLNQLRRRLAEPALAPLRDWLDAQLGAEFGAQPGGAGGAFAADRARLLRHCNPGAASSLSTVASAATAAGNEG